MIQISFKGRDLFEFKDENFIQMVGNNEELKRLIIDIYLKIFNGYKFSDIDMASMKGYYPEVKKEGKVLNKKDMQVIRISSVQDIFEELQVKKGSVILEYILSLNDEVTVTKVLEQVEESLLGLTVELDKHIEKDVLIDNLSIVTEFTGINFKKIVSSFIEINFINEEYMRKPLWLLKEVELINLFSSVIELLIKNKKNITLIIDSLDIRLGDKEYKYFINKLYTLAEENSNLKVWLVPKSENGVMIDYKIFNNTYILNDEIIVLGDFETTYDSICRNYPDNNLPVKDEVLDALLRLMSFHNKDKIYSKSKEAVILQIFLKLSEQDSIKVENTKLSDLESKFLTSF